VGIQVTFDRKIALEKGMRWEKSCQAVHVPTMVDLHGPFFASDFGNEEYACVNVNHWGTTREPLLKWLEENQIEYVES
jgi:hypothetical protein